MIDRSPLIIVFAALVMGAMAFWTIAAPDGLAFAIGKLFENESFVRSPQWTTYKWSLVIVPAQHDIPMKWINTETKDECIGAKDMALKKLTFRNLLPIDAFCLPPKEGK